MRDGERVYFFQVIIWIGSFLEVAVPDVLFFLTNAIFV